MSSHSSSHTVNHDTAQPNLYWVNGVLFLLLLTVVATAIGCLVVYKTNKTVQYKMVEAQYVPRSLNLLRTNEVAYLNNLAWKDKATGVVKLPISDAMSSVVKRYQ